MSREQDTSCGPPGPDRWEGRYQGGDTPWNRGSAPVALLDLIQAETTPRRVLVPGCGHGHDAIAWAAAGHEVVAVDIAPSAVEAAKELAADAGVTVDWRLADVFDLPALEPFDVVWEQTCYCAIPVDQRHAYIDVVAGVLKPEGRFLGLLWNHGREGGPPFDVTKADIESRFGGRFTIDALVDAPSERGPEFVARLTLR